MKREMKYSRRKKKSKEGKEPVVNFRKEMPSHLFLAASSRIPEET